MNIIEWQPDLDYFGWREYRKKISGVGESWCRVGASDISSLTGSNKWTSKRRLYLSMIGYLDRDFRNKSTLLGHDMEPIVAKAFERYNVDEEVYFDNRQYNTPERYLKKAEFFVLNDKYPHFSASLDYIPDGESFSPFTGELYHPYTPHECKVIQDFVYKEWDGAVPQHYLEQLHVQMANTDTDVAVFMPFISTGDFYPVEVYRDQSLIDYLHSEAVDFAKLCTKGKILKLQIEESNCEREQHDLRLELESLVPLDDIPDEVDLANELMQSGKEFLKVHSDSEEVSKMVDYLEANSEIGKLESLKNKLRAELTQMADGYAGIESEDYKATIRGNNAVKKSYFRILEKKN